MDFAEATASQLRGFNGACFLFVRSWPLEGARLFVFMCFIFGAGGGAWDLGFRAWT